MATQEVTTVGIDFGGTFVKLGVCRGGELLESGEPIPTPDHQGSTALIRAMADRVASMRQRFPDIAAVGVGVPGLVNFDTGFVHELTNVPGWNEVHLKDELSELTGLPCVVENDANAMCYAEWRYGAGKGLQNVVALTLGTGVGAGLILNGQMYRGSSFSAGELGQMSVDYKGLRGHYGNLGALEKYIGNQQIADYAAQLYAREGKRRYVGDCTPKAIARAAEEGDKVALQVWDDVADWLGTTLAGIAWLLNPDAFIIGGGVAQAGDLIFEPLKKKMRSALSEVVMDKLQIMPARFQNEAGIIGNAALAADLL
jgi:glucokinase